MDSKKKAFRLQLARIGISELTDEDAVFKEILRHMRIGKYEDFLKRGAYILDSFEVPDDLSWFSSHLLETLGPEGIPKGELPVIRKAIVDFYNRLQSVRSLVCNLFT